jgi:hypothetical protein
MLDHVALWSSFSSQYKSSLCQNRMEANREPKTVHIPTPRQYPFIFFLCPFYRTVQMLWQALTLYVLQMVSNDEMKVKASFAIVRSPKVLITYKLARAVWVSRHQLGKYSRDDTQGHIRSSVTVIGQVMGIGMLKFVLEDAM